MGFCIFSPLLYQLSYPASSSGNHISADRALQARVAEIFFPAGLLNWEIVLLRT